MCFVLFGGIMWALERQLHSWVKGGRDNMETKIHFIEGGVWAKTFKGWIRSMFGKEVRLGR
jgi:hypothetical protein